MPRKELRNLSVQRTCQRPSCGMLFHPFRGRESGPHAQRFCSNDCSRAFGTFTLSGHWPEPARPAQPAPTTPLQPLQLSALMDLDDPAQVRREWQQEGARLAQMAARLERLGQARRREVRTVTVSGHGAWLGVEHDALVCHDGRTYGAPGRREVFHKTLHDLAHVVLLGPEFTLTGPALAWCQGEEVGVSVLDADGGLLAVLIPPPDRVRDDVALRRRQYTLSADEQTAFARQLVGRKLRVQRETLLRHIAQVPDRAAVESALDVLGSALAWLDLTTPPPWLCGTEGLGMLRALEARGAKRYFEALASVPLRWAKADLRRVPAHWLTLGPRTSPLAPDHNARHAVRPGQSVLNYAYGLLERQCRQALTVAGFDVAAGIMHLDRLGRDSLCFDLMELRRGEVDTLVVQFLSQTVLRYADVTRVPDGCVRLHPQVACVVVAACRLPQDRIDEDARWLRLVLLTSTADAATRDQTAALCSAVL